MFDLLQQVAAQSVNPALFLWGMGIIYCTGIVLLIAVVLKFWQHSKYPQKLNENLKHSFSTQEMLICVLVLFPFWVNSFGQIPTDTPLQYVYFGVGIVLVLWGLIWHLWAKINIRFMWSDGIEIKQQHQLVTSGAYALARHPMYASLLMWGWGASLLMFNWMTIALITLVFLPLMINRAKAEEKELVKAQPDYVLYQQNVRMLTPTISGLYAVLIKIVAIALFGYYIWAGITLPSILLLFLIHFYLGYSLTPEKVAFSYRSKSVMTVVFWGLSLLWSPFYYLLYVILAMFIYGLKFNCPCMIVYNKYHRCPCFDLVQKCIAKKHD